LFRLGVVQIQEEDSDLGFGID